MIRRTIASFGGVSRRYYVSFSCFSNSSAIGHLQRGHCSTELAGPDPQRRRKGTISSEADVIKPSLAAARSVRLGGFGLVFAMGAHLPGSDGRSYGRSPKPFLSYVKTRL